nr:hypothetical protein [Brucella anthropi]
MLKVSEVAADGRIAPHGDGYDGRRPSLRIPDAKVTAPGPDKKAKDSNSVASRRDMKGGKAGAGFGIVDVDGGVGKELPHLVDIADIDGLKERRVQPPAFGVICLAGTIGHRVRSPAGIPRCAL